MTTGSDPSFEVRRVNRDDWLEIRALRIESTSDPDAAIAFLEHPDEVASRPDEFWRSRAEGASSGETAAQFVAVLDGAWIGSLTVLIRDSGQTDHLGRSVGARRADIVGVYVRPADRGTGVVDELLAAAAQWAASLGLDALHLDVHRDNARAQAAYRRAGFVPTGAEISSVIGIEIEMARPLPSGATSDA